MNPTAGDPVVVLEGLTRRFGTAVAVADLSFAVERAELFGIVGPDGAGKTTTLRLLAGVLPPTSGDARLFGISVAREPERVKPQLAYMAQRFGLYEDLTVAENIHFYADLYRVPRRERADRIERLHAFSRLGEFSDRLAGALSGGMKQKLALSCALVHRPALLLLDEPTFGVDPISRRDLWLILHEMVAEGVTIVVSTSYLDEAERCDRVVLLDRGRVLAFDRPAALQAAFPGRLLSVATAEPRDARDRLRDHPAVARATLFGRNLHVQLAPGGSPEAVAAALAAAAIPTEGIVAIEPSLEDVFIDRVAGSAVS
ncbi:MAG: ABC transporter ATP-binding protein [Gemmatimonadetes bacterium]|nr:ABC transporter ATP-binding protein [Gemmatimonadota bacterium]MCC7132880.1 ABC transporter ATP-binding protein [Gemmatimonadales bacterium]